MKFKGNLSKLWVVAIVLINLIMIALFFVAESVAGQIMCLPVIIIMDLYMIPVLFQNYVTVDKQRVVVYFGLLKTEIPVKKITSVNATVNYKAALATSTKRLAIHRLGKEPLYISLEDNDKFVKELLKKNNKIRYYIGE